VRSQKEMVSIQGKRSISFAGAWLRYGVHEDGFTSGLRAVIDHIPHVQPPFDIQYAEREPASALLALSFDILGRSGARAILGILAQPLPRSTWAFLGLQSYRRRTKLIDVKMCTSNVTGYFTAVVCDTD